MRNSMWAPRKGLLITAACVLVMGVLAGCGGGGSQNSSTTLTGVVTGLEALPAIRESVTVTSYPAVAGATVYAQNAQTGQQVGTQTTSDANGRFRLDNLPAGVDLVVVAAKDSVQLRGMLRSEERRTSSTCNVDPDTTLATSLYDQLKSHGSTAIQLAESYELALAYQNAHQWQFGGRDGSPPDLTEQTDIDLAARQCLQATANAQLVEMELDNGLETSRLAIAIAMSDAILNNDADFPLTDVQSDLLALREHDEDIWTNAELASLLSDAGIQESGGAVTEAGVALARTALRTRMSSLDDGPKSCACEGLMVCLQASGVAPFRVTTQTQLDSLVQRLTQDE